MREIAKAADLSVGAAYYYFSTKDEFVMAFYEQTLEESLEVVDELVAPHRKLERRLHALMEHKFDQMKPYEKFISVIVRNAAEPGNPLSPFSAETKHIRDRAMDLVESAVEGSTLRVDSTLEPHLRELLWFHHMGLIFFWIHDPSPGKSGSYALSKLSSRILVSLLGFTRFRLVRPITRQMVTLLELLKTLYSIK